MKFNNAIMPKIGNIDISLNIYSQPRRALELLRGVPLTPPLGKIGAFPLKYLNAIIIEIRCMNVTCGIKSDGRCDSKPSTPNPHAAPFPHILSFGM